MGETEGLGREGYVICSVLIGGTLRGSPAFLGLVASLGLGHAPGYFSV